MDNWLSYVCACEDKQNTKYLSHTYFGDIPGIPGDLPYPKSGTLSELADFYIQEMDKQDFKGQILIENKIPTDSALKNEDWFFVTKNSLFRKLYLAEMEQLQDEIKKRLPEKEIKKR